MLEGSNVSLLLALSSPPSSTGPNMTSSHSLSPDVPTVRPGGLSGSIGPAGIGKGFVFNPKIACMIAQLWEDPIMARVMDHSSKVYVMDSAR